MISKILIAVAAGYLLGNLNGAILISKLLVHDDVRQHGSGNAGFTNFFRNYGGFASLLVLFIDAGKSVAACLIGRMLLGAEGYALEGAVLGGLAVSLGHDFPALLGFHGGKGIVSGFAGYMTIDWRTGLIALAAFVFSYLPIKYVSLSSIAAALTVGISFTLLNPGHPWAIAGCWVMVALALFMHRQNIGRLLKGTETKTDFFKKEKKA